MSIESFWTIRGTVLSSDSYRFLFTVHQAHSSPKIKEKLIPHDPFNRNQTHRFPVSFWLPRLNRPCGELLDSGCEMFRTGLIGEEDGEGEVWFWSGLLLVIYGNDPSSFCVSWQWQTSWHCEEELQCILGMTALTLYGLTCLDPFHICRNKVLLNTCNGSGCVPYTHHNSIENLFLF